MIFNSKTWPEVIHVQGQILEKKFGDLFVVQNVI